VNGPHPLHSHLLSVVEAGPAAALGGGKARRPSASRGFFSASLYTTILGLFTVAGCPNSVIIFQVT